MLLPKQAAPVERTADTGAGHPAGSATVALCDGRAGPLVEAVKCGCQVAGRGETVGVPCAKCVCRVAR